MDEEKECIEHGECEDKFRTLRWMVGLLMSISLVGFGFMIKASVTASNVSAQINLFKADYESRFTLVESKYGSEVDRLNREIVQTKADNNKDLVNAIQKVGYDQQRASDAVLRLAENNQIKLSELSKKVDELKSKVK